MNVTNLNLGQDLPSELQFAINMICHLTGECPTKIARLHKDEIYTMLSFLMKCEKDKIKKIAREYNINQSLDSRSLQVMWKQIEKGLVSIKKKGFLPLDEKVDESIRINFARFSRRVMIDAGIAASFTRYPVTTTVAPVALNQNAGAVVSLENLMKMAHAHTVKQQPAANTISQIYPK